MPDHAAMRHSGKAYVGREVHTNGIESFWVVLK